MKTYRLFQLYVYPSHIAPLRQFGHTWCLSVCLYVCLPQHHFPANRTSVLPDAPMTLSHLFLAWGEGLTHGTCKGRGEEIGRKDEIMRVDGQVFATIPWLHSGGTTWQHPGRERLGCELQSGSDSAWPRPGVDVQQKLLIV